ncbi:helix-turn-helix domain-containing protein, partial [Candidatus Curtissbacteria bacterium]|nr:helix-turn-helix domain-containing protein [Candidatus Curtissbacteria bacterium]MBI2327989.1 helix-turn-helix domain-containing protein [Candidatus Curtissbacteria bacterium]MBI2328038.1 helix-turn-helix domain-containing protein [Candidatus Curtissbacteria bacterium]
MQGMKNYHQLTIHEREQIKLFLSQGKSLRAIAK